MNILANIAGAAIGSFIWFVIMLIGSKCNGLTSLGITLWVLLAGVGGFLGGLSATAITRSIAGSSKMVPSILLTIVILIFCSIMFGFATGYGGKGVDAAFLSWVTIQPIGALLGGKLWPAVSKWLGNNDSCDGP